MKKSSISNSLRKIGLIQLADKIRFFFIKLKNNKINQDFKQKFPNVKLPDDYTIYESFQLNYEKYYLEGKDTAQKYLDIFEKHIDLNNKDVLEWGCGPARILRHFPSLMSKYNISFTGTDYNQNTIKWCQNNIPNIKFIKNELAPPLNFSDNSFDIILSNSVFTHLSETQHQKWIKELYRILKKNGILVFTTHGEITKIKLSDTEKNTFESGKIVERGLTKEGHRTFTAFHPLPFVHQLVDQFQIKEHIPGHLIGKIPTQDCWIVQK